ncbi:GGDEF domain-containing protein [Pantoea ananatis]|uniref:GGDEF domain-containing protein n=1 Tax=Pantoea ananas TaxID=553 RepID=UPI0023AEDBCC|nr:GGDEF domain-containing protein [Pantoea ananatis]
MTDHLTKLQNRRGFEQLTATLIALQASHSVASFDIHHFKQINDQHGHDVGDLVLVTLSGLLKKGCRTQDIISRFGGEEFVIFFTNTTLEEAVFVSDRIRKNIADWQFPVVGRVTVSAGACSLMHCSNDLQKALLKADEHLYRAKYGGRNRVIASLVKNNHPEQ